MHRDADIISLLTQLPLVLPAFALILFRVAGLMLAAPLFGNPVIPLRLRVVLAGMIALALFPLVGPTVPTTLGFGGALVGIVGETLIGLTMGLALSLVLMGAELAGELAGQQAGLSLGQIINPMSSSESTVLASIYAVVFQALFLAVGGHRALLRALLDTFAVIPPASYRVDARVAELLTNLLSSSFILALKLAAPVLIAMFLTSVALGLVSRSIPQLNILTVGFALRALMAIGIAALALSASQGVFLEFLADAMDALRAAFGLGPSEI